MKILEKRKSKNKEKFISNMYVEEIQKYKNEKINVKIHEKLKRGISQEQQSSYQQATTQANK